MERLDADSEAAVRSTLERICMDSAAGQRMRDNLEREGQLSQEAWRGLVTLLEAPYTTEVTWQMTIHLRLHHEIYQLQGDVDENARGCPMGRLTTLSDFVNMIVEQDPDGMLDWQIEAVLVRDVFGAPPENLPAWLKKLQLGLHVLWGALGLPEIPSREAAKRTWCRCGLPNVEDDHDIVFIRYMFPETHRAHAPTIGDAYADWPWPRYFRTADIDKSGHRGKTDPRLDCAEAGGVWEVVSKPVRLQEVCEPIRLFRREGVA